MKGLSIYISMHFNYLMEDKFETSERALDEEQGKDLMIQAKRTSESPEKNVVKIKRETLKVKKIQKKDANGIDNGSIINNELLLSLNSQEDEASVSVSKPKGRKEKLEERWMQQSFPHSLDKLLMRPPYIGVGHNNRITGNFGHGTVLFKRPLIEGCYFLEVLIREDAKNQQKTTYRSAVRVGLCQHSFNPSFPLGYGESFAYKSSDGLLIRNGSVLQRCDPARAGDVIGICVNVGPPSKYPDSEKAVEGNLVTFYKNGKILGSCGSLKQTFYCFGVSLFNFGQVQILRGVNNRFKMLPEAKSYFSSLNQKIPYKNLQSKKMFKL